MVAVLAALAAIRRCRGTNSTVEPVDKTSCRRCCRLLGLLVAVVQLLLAALLVDYHTVQQLAAMDPAAMGMAAETTTGCNDGRSGNAIVALVWLTRCRRTIPLRAVTGRRRVPCSSRREAQPRR